MFTGIIEATAEVKEVISNGSNKTFWLESAISNEFRVDQSISHSGVCLTVEEIIGNRHRVTAIGETLKKTNLSSWQPGQVVNLEQCLSLSSLLDGHLVQGHVDTTIICKKRKEKQGSREFEFSLPKKYASLVIEKGSVCINGISLTAFRVKSKSFRIAVIPYTFEHTDIRNVEAGSIVNIEFDILGKYISRQINL